MESVTSINFEVLAKTRHGEEIRLLGNTPSLGCDEIVRAIPLVTSATSYPKWITKSSILLPQKCGSIRYRYCLFSGGKFVRFEKVTNRSLLSKNGQLILDTNDVFDEEAANTLPAENRTSRQVKARKFIEHGRTSSVSEAITTKDSVVVVSFYLPVTLRKVNNEWTAEWSENILAFQTNLRVSWVGSVKPTDTITSEDEESIAICLRKMNCFPIFLKSDVYHKFYNQYCK